MITHQPSSFSEAKLLSWLRFNNTFDISQTILETIFQANLLTGAIHSAFSTNHLTDIDKTEHN